MLFDLWSRRSLGGALSLGHWRNHLCAQVNIYLSWLRWLLDIALSNKPYVIVNMDETNISSRHRRVRGLLLRGSAIRDPRHRRQQDRPDRTDLRSSLFGCITDQPELQPLLPQVFVAKYTGARRPPAWMTRQCAVAGFPLEYWHGTNGSATPTLVQAWATRLRSVVHSFNDEAFILLILDCHTAHLDLATVRHLNMLGILTIFIPAKLTWLLQALDVYVFSELKATMQRIESQARLLSATGQLEPGAWIANTARAVDHVLVERDWSGHFDRLGAGVSCDALRPELLQYLHGQPVRPRLPTRADMALLLNRNQESDNFIHIFQSLMTTALRVNNQEPGNGPRQGARVPLPFVPPAQKRQRVDEEEDPVTRVSDHLNAVDALFPPVVRPDRVQSRQVQFGEP